MFLKSRGAISGFFDFSAFLIDTCKSTPDRRIN